MALSKSDIGGVDNNSECQKRKIYPHEGLHLANQSSRKLGVFGRKLEGSHSVFDCYFQLYQRKLSMSNVFFIDIN